LQSFHAAGNPPVVLTGLRQGEHRFKVIPLGCGRRYTALPLRFNVWNWPGPQSIM